MKGTRSSITAEGHHEILKNESQNLWLWAWYGAKDDLFRLLSSSSKTKGMYVPAGNVLSGIDLQFFRMVIALKQFAYIFNVAL